MCRAPCGKGCKCWIQEKATNVEIWIKNPGNIKTDQEHRRAMAVRQHSPVKYGRSADHREGGDLVVSRTANFHVVELSIAAK
jgi:hypothetical protein